MGVLPTPSRTVGIDAFDNQSRTNYKLGLYTISIGEKNEICYLPDLRGEIESSDRDIGYFGRADGRLFYCDVWMGENKRRNLLKMGCQKDRKTIILVTE